MKICKKCGAKAGDGMRFCPMCGEKFPPDMPKSWKEASVPVRKGNLVTFGVYPQSAKAKGVKLERAETLPFGSAGGENVLWRGDDGEYYAGREGFAEERFKYEPIVWRVIREEGKKLLLLADKILDSCSSTVGYRNGFDEYEYIEQNGARTVPHKRLLWVFAAEDMKRSAYEGSYAREWLNGHFFGAAFSPEAQKYILTTAVDNSAKSTGDPACPFAGTSTRDKIFLLSYEEAAQTLGLTGASRKRKRTDFAADHLYDASEYFSWVLRSPALSQRAKIEKLAEGSPFPAGRWSRHGFGKRHGESGIGVCGVNGDGRLLRPTLSSYCYAVPAMWIQMP